MNRPAILVTGATSQIGVFAIPRLLHAGFRVVALSRKGKPERDTQYDQVQWLTGPADPGTVNTCQYLLSAAPMTVALEILQSGKHFHTAVVFSSTSVITKQQSSDPAERQQIQEMIGLESEFESLASARRLKLLILKPSMIYGCGLDTNISRLGGWIRRFGFIPINGKANGLRQPVHADDLAAAAVTALLSEVSLPSSLVLAGGSTLSYADMVTRIFTAMDQPARLLRVPQWLFILLVNILAVFRPAMGINSEMVRRQTVDLVFDNRQAMELIGYKPRPFEPTKKDFVMPHSDL